MIMAKRNRHRKTKHLLEQNIHPKSAGIDIGAELIVAAIALDLKDDQPVRSFGSFTSDLNTLASWLLSHQITTVAMESTGVYWIPLYDILEKAGIEVCLVNARHVKGVPGKKTDVCDAQWLQQLHSAGLLKASFRPRTEVVQLRQLMRHRENLIQERSRQLQQMQKSLNEMNLKIHHVFSDLDGVSAMKIVESILSGEREADTLWGLRDGRVKAKKEIFLKAMEGSYDEHQLFILKQHHSLWSSLQQLIYQADQEIGEALKALNLEADKKELPAQKKHRLKVKNGPAFEAFEQAYQCYGVDLSTIDGVSSNCLSVLMSELGNRNDILSHFKSAKAFSSWLGLCPDNRISGGKVLKSKTRPVVNRVAKAFRLCAFSVGRSDGAMGKYARRMKGKLGKAEGITAVAHKIARLVYAMITNQKPYDSKQAFKENNFNKQKKLKVMKKLAEELHYEVSPAC